MPGVSCVVLHRYHLGRSSVPIKPMTEAHALDQSVRRATGSEVTAEALDRLPRELGDQVEVLVHVESCEAGQLRGCGDQ